MSLSQNNPINSASEATFKTTLQQYKSDLSMSLAKLFANNLNNNITGVNSTTTDELKAFIPSITTDDLTKYKVENGRLIYIGNEYKKYNWAKQMDSVLPIVTDQQIIYLDSTLTNSYSGTGNIWYDISGNNNNFTLLNSPTISNGSFLFNGTNQYAVLANNPTTFSYNRNAFTVCGWVYYDVTPFPYYGALIVKWNTGASQNNEFILNIDSNNKFNFAVDFPDSMTPDVQTNDTIYSTATPILNKWYYVCGVFNNGILQLYVDSVLQGSVTNTYTQANTDTNSSLQISRFGNSYYGKGLRSVIQMYNKALTQDEINQNYNALKYRFQ